MKLKTTKDLLVLPEADVVVNYIISRKKSGLYSLVMAAGLPGSGKTSTCFRIGELLSEAILGKNIITSENIIDNLVDLVRFVRKASPENLCIAIIEEVGVLFPSRRAMSGINVDLAKILDTCRKKQVILLANAPIWPSIDSHMRAMGNVYIQTLKIYRTTKVVVSKMYRLQTDPRTGKTYTHYFQRSGRDVLRMYTKMPNTGEWNKYENKKDSFMDDVYERIELRAKKRMDKESKELGMMPKKRTVVKPLTEQEIKVLHMKDFEKKTYKTISEALGVDPSRICRVYQKVKEKLNFTKKNDHFDIKNPLQAPVM